MLRHSVRNRSGLYSALANGREVDIVFSDVMMPGTMDGLELAHELQRRYLGLPVLLTSGYLAITKQKADSASVRLLAKPYRLEELDQAFKAVRCERIDAHATSTPAIAGSSA